MSAIIAIHQHALKVPEMVTVIEQRERRFLLKSPLQLHRQVAPLHPECQRRDQTKHNIVRTFLLLV